MDSPLNKADLLAKIREGRTQWETLLLTVPPDRKETPGPAGGGAWSVKDVIAHVVESERWLARELRKLHGETLPPSPDDHNPEMGDTHKRNAIYYQRNRNRPLADIQADAERVYHDLRAAIEQLSDAELAATDPWGVGRPLINIIPYSTYKHYAELTPDLKAWLEIDNANQ